MKAAETPSYIGQTALQNAVWSLEDEARTLDRVASWVGDASVVLLGEETHGTDEFYRLRASLTKRLMQKHGFSAVAIEGDWPDSYQVHRYVTLAPPDPVDPLAGFSRFPHWMWRNRAMVEFVTWLRARNRMIDDPVQRAGFYGLDLYSLTSSIQGVLSYLQKVDPEAARAARASYACFDHLGRDAEQYAWVTRDNESATCEESVVRELLRLQEQEGAYVRRDGVLSLDEFFSAEQNARVARNAEQYYRTMFKGRVASWNLRDQHMAETLAQLIEHLKNRGQSGKIVVWAHNSHVGDARATEASEHGELNLGQLARESFGEAVRLIGFSTYTGTVTAASDWDAPSERKRVRPALRDSYEEFFHHLGIGRFFVPLRGPGAIDPSLLPERALQRAIGVVYRPDTERWSHYYFSRLAAQFDGVVHVDQTHAVVPLEPTTVWESGEVPETFPSGV